MDNLIGQRFSLISKSEIRYVGTLHEIHPEQSTIALEDVFSFGTEDRQVASFIPPSQQKFEYIVFRGSDVKDIKIEEEQPKANKQQQQTPDDPAILNSSRPGPAQPSQGPAPGPPSNRGESPFPPPPNFPPQGYGGYYGPPPGQFGRGYGPPPPGSFGPGPGYPPYGPPPPGYYGPPGQNFPPQGPGRFPPQQQPHPPPIGPPGQRPPPPGQPQQQPPPQPQQQLAPAPGLPAPAQAVAPAIKPTPELPVEKATEKTSKPTTPAPPADSIESLQPTNIPAPATLPAQAPPGPKQAPTQPKGRRITPAMPFAVNQTSFTPPVSSDTPQSTAQQSSTKPVKTQAEMDEASRKAKEAVQNALANLNSQPAPPAQVAQPTPPTIDNITERVAQISTGPPSQRGQRGGYRGQRPARTASGGHRPPPQKMEIPQSDFDFESANAKFNKEDLIKEAIASGSPIAEDPPSTTTLDASVNGALARNDSYSSNSVPAYNKSSSFFDNISSEAKDREESRDINGRALRGAEFKKNVETFGQGNVDSGYRGRGRGGYRGQRRGYAGNRDANGGYRGGYRGRGRGDADDTAL